MLENVIVYWHGQLWISGQTCALALFVIALAYSAYMAQCNAVTSL